MLEQVRKKKKDRVRKKDCTEERELKKKEEERSEILSSRNPGKWKTNTNRRKGNK